VGGLLNKIQYCDCELRIGQRVRLWIHCLSCLQNVYQNTTHKQRSDRISNYSHRAIERERERESTIFGADDWCEERRGLGFLLRRKRGAHRLGFKRKQDQIYSERLRVES